MHSEKIFNLKRIRIPIINQTHFILRVVIARNGSHIPFWLNTVIVFSTQVYNCVFNHYESWLRDLSVVLTAS